MDVVLLLAVGILMWLKACLASFGTDDQFSDELVERYEAAEADYRFLWTVADFAQLQGASDRLGVPLEDIIARYGKSSEVSDYSTENWLTIQSVATEDQKEAAEDPPRVELHFQNQDGVTASTVSCSLIFPCQMSWDLTRLWLEKMDPDGF